MITSSLAFLALTPSLPLTVDYRSTQGLQVEAGGIPIVLGSFFQLFEPDWSKGLFSSRWNEPTVTRDGNTLNVRQEALEKQFLATAKFEVLGNDVKIDYRFEWKGDRPVRVEACLAEMWATAVPRAFGDKPPTKSGEAVEKRRLGADRATWTMPFLSGNLQVRASQPLMGLDHRGESRPHLWLGSQDVILQPGKTHELNLTISLPDVNLPAVSERVSGRMIPLDSIVEKPAEGPPMLLPKPKDDRLKWDQPVELPGTFTFPAGRTKLQDFKESVALRYPFPLPKAGEKAMEFDGGESDLGLAPGGYRIEIRPGRITVLGEKNEGLRNGLRRLGQLVFVKNGKLMLPTGMLIDQPSLPWRGVHLFVGPQAGPFHRALWRKVLLQMGFNKVVLQLERTDWQAAPGIKTPITMSKADLVSLADWYEAEGIELIPLIQSFGHMEWLFENKKNLDLAFNREIPYSVDPRVPRTNEMLGKIWNEAIDLLRPKTIHYGLDEVDMLGWPKDPQLVTDLWKAQLRFLGNFAREKNLEMMLWGDKALGPGEAPDAMHAETLEHAEARRAAIPRGSWVTTWHYKGDQNPQTFMGVLDLWKRKGYRPIGAGWYLPENVRGLALAAIPFRAGYLQTTWAGYESHLTNVERAFDQFAAMLLAGDYAWSGRQERIEDLPYNYREEFRKRFYGVQMPLAGIKVDRFQPEVSLGSVLNEGPVARRASIPFSGKGRQLRAEFSAVADLGEGDTGGELTIRYADGTQAKQPLRYGTHFRAKGDSQPVRMPQVLIPLDLTKQISSIELSQTALTTGLTLSKLEIIR